MRVTAALVAICCALPACSPGSRSGAGSGADEGRAVGGQPPPVLGHENAGALPSGVPSGVSLYELEMALTDQTGRRIGLDVGAGHPVLLSMFYATCPHACPMLIADIRRFEASLDEPTREKTRVLLVSLDPARDDQKALAELAELHGVDPKRWSLARASEEDVRTLAALLGIKYRFLPDGNINHSSIITVLSPEGEIALRVDGLRQPAEPVVERIGGMVGRRAGS